MKRFQLFVIILLIYSKIYSQNYQPEEFIKTCTYSNKYIMNGKSGMCFLLDSSQVVIKWPNGYFALGTMSNGYLTGPLLIYDKKNRCRHIYRLFGEVILHHEIMDKRGKVIYNSGLMEPNF